MTVKELDFQDPLILSLTLFLSWLFPLCLFSGG